MMPFFDTSKLEPALAASRKLFDISQTHPLARRFFLHQPARISLLIWPALWGLASQAGGFFASLGIILAMLMLKIAANLYEDLLAPTPQNDDTLSSLILAILLSVALWILWMLSPLALFWSILWVILIAGYPFIRKTVWMPQVYAGVIYGALPVLIGAGAAAGYSFVLLPLTIAGFFWAVTVETLHATANTEEDMDQGIKSTPLFLGDNNIPFTIATSVLFLLFLLFSGSIISAGMPFYLALMITEGLFFFAWQEFTENPHAVLRITAIAGACTSIGIFF